MGAWLVWENDEPDMKLSRRECVFYEEHVDNINHPTF